MAMHLSPRTLNGLRAFRSIVASPGEPTTHEKKHIVEVSFFLCPVCDEQHDHRSDAVDCCDEEDEVNVAADTCPVCAREHSEPRLAVDCCLWKDLDAPTRWMVADQVEAGATWAEALKLPDPLTGQVS